MHATLFLCLTPFFMPYLCRCASNIVALALTVPNLYDAALYPKLICYALALHSKYAFKRPQLGL